MALRRIIRPSAEAVSTTEPRYVPAAPGSFAPDQPLLTRTERVLLDEANRTAAIVGEPPITPKQLIETLQQATQAADAEVPRAGALVSVNDAARLAGIARRTMYYWIAKGLVRTSRVASGRLRVEVASLFRPQEPAA